MIIRAALAAVLALGLFLAPLAAAAQQSVKVPRIGYLAISSLESPEGQATLDAFRQGLRERGYVEGQNIVIEYRVADGKIQRFPGLATELARLKVELLITGSTPAARALQQATTTIPIVAAVMGDPVGDGLVASLARPGGNITGLTFLGPELVPKRLELLKQALPKRWCPGSGGKERWRILPVGAVNNQRAAWQGGYRRNAPWARVSGSPRERRSLRQSR